MALETTTTSNANQLPASSDGKTFGASASDPISFHGATPIAKATVATLAGTLTGTIDGTIADIAATAGNCQGTVAPSATQVDTAIATAVASIVTGSNTQLKELQTVLNNLVSAMQTKGIIKQS